MILDNKYNEKSPSYASLYTWLSTLLVTLFLSAVVAFSSTSFAARPKIPLVTVEKARTQTIVKQTPLVGTVISPKVSRLSSETSGQVKTIKADIGDQVKKGDTLLQLDQEIEALTLRASRASTLKAREQLAEARRRFESAKSLKKQNSISVEEIDQREAEVKIAGAVLEQQQAEEQKQEAIVKRHTIKAPFDGVITRKSTELGEWVDTGKAVMTLVAMDKLGIDFQVAQELYNQIDETSRITVTLDALPGKSFVEKIATLVPDSDSESRTFLVRINIDNEKGHLTPGMSAQGKLRINTGEVGVIVSRDAIMRYPDGRVSVWVINMDSEIPKVSEQRVKTGHSFNGQITITNGLLPGAVVVVQGNESLKEDQNVRIHQSQ